MSNACPISTHRSTGFVAGFFSTAVLFPILRVARNVFSHYLPLNVDFDLQETPGLYRSVRARRVVSVLTHPIDQGGVPLLAPMQLKPLSLNLTRIMLHATLPPNQERSPRKAARCNTHS